MVPSNAVVWQHNRSTWSRCSCLKRLQQKHLPSCRQNLLNYGTKCKAYIAVHTCASLEKESQSSFELFLIWLQLTQASAIPCNFSLSLSLSLSLSQWSTMYCQVLVTHDFVKQWQNCWSGNWFNIRSLIIRFFFTGLLEISGIAV